MTGTKSWLFVSAETKSRGLIFSTFHFLLLHPWVPSGSKPIDTGAAEASRRFGKTLWCLGGLPGVSKLSTRYLHAAFIHFHDEAPTFRRALNRVRRENADEAWRAVADAALAASEGSRKTES